MRIWVGISFIIILYSLSSCRVQKSVTKKDEVLTKAIMVKSLKPGKVYRIWDKKGSSYEKVKITSVDSVEIAGMILYRGTTTHFKKTHEEILASTQKITYKKVDPVVTVLILGISSLLIIPIILNPVGNITIM